MARSRERTLGGQEIRWRRAPQGRGGRTSSPQMETEVPAEITRKEPPQLLTCVKMKPWLSETTQRPCPLPPELASFSDYLVFIFYLQET